jgi:ribosomal protein L22
LDESKLAKPDKVYDAFTSDQQRLVIYGETNTINSRIFSLELVEFKKFKSVADALKVSTSVENGKVAKSLKKLLSSAVTDAEELIVGDTKLCNLIKVSL